MTDAVPRSVPQDRPLWEPSEDRVKACTLSLFMRNMSEETGRKFETYDDLWQWSIEETEAFWSSVWDLCGVIGEKGGTILRDGDKMPGAAFFPDARLNYAENLLRRQDDHLALIFRTETGQERTLTFSELRGLVARTARALRESGVKVGDRVAGYMPNMPETIIAMLATASIGAIWSSASPDFGVEGVTDRFGQIEPKILFTVDGYFYGGKTIDCLEKIRKIQPQLPGLVRTVIVPFVNERPDLSDLSPQTTTFSDFIEPYDDTEPEFERLPFSHPLYIMFSSGTTGKPKCIVHGAGGTLIQHLKEHRLHCDIRRDDRVFYFTTCGWMMWNWLVSALASEATLLLYDGSPFHPDGHVLWEYTTRHQCSFFGTSAKYIDALKGNGLRIGEVHDLSCLRTLASTGSPLVHESFDYVYETIKPDLHLASISGGTDIVSCFVLGNPISSVWRGEIQCAGLGMAVNVFEENGKPLPAGAGSGDLVCTKPFPSMPTGFWADPDGSRYRAAYFEEFPNVWHHGDWIERTAHGGFIIHGRSDATLNPGGVRIGTAEIYRQVEQIPDVLESIAIGQEWDGDVRVILFVVLRNGRVLDDTLRKEIVSRIRAGASPRHVPAKILQVSDIPRTRSGKITELAVKHVIHGRPVRNVEALSNPESLDFYRDLPELKE